MARLYLSFLGTTDYEECVYYQGEKPPPEDRLPTRFVQEATIRRYCQGWGAGDRIVIFTTCKAYRKNWLDGGHGEEPSKNKNNFEGLKTRIAAMGLPSGLSAQYILIPDGSDEAEIWDIFRIVFDTIKRGDEVVFDITHALRSIPMLAIVILSYAKVLKQITISGICYGAFEVLGSMNEVRQKPIKDRLAPILDLTPIAELLEWTAAVDRFVSSGDPAKVSALTKAGVRPILKQTKGADQAADTLRRIAGSLEHFCAVMSTCRGRQISEAAKCLNIQLEALERSDILPPFAPLFEEIRNKLKPFEGDPLRDGLKAVRWCLDHGLIQQGFTILNEALISWVLCAAIRETSDIECAAIRETSDIEIRRLPVQAATILTKGLVDRPEKWEPPAIKHKDFTRGIICFLKKNPSVQEALDQIKVYRNDINHAGYRKDSINETKFALKLDELLKKVEDLAAGG